MYNVGDIMYNVGDKLVCIEAHIGREVGEIITINSIGSGGSLEHDTNLGGYCRILNNLIANWELVKPVTVKYTEGDVVYQGATKYIIVRPYVKYETKKFYSGATCYLFEDDLSKDEPVKEVTMADLEAKYGCKIKVVK